VRPFRFFGVAANGPVDARQLTQTARQAEAAGFAGLVLPDHLLDQHAPVPVLATVAAVTERLRIGSFVFNTGLRHPAVLAQDLATLDVLSGGRLDIGLGAGWNRPEHDAIGVPFEPVGRRIDRLAETVAVLKGCFGAEPFSYQGTHFTLDHHDGLPKPVQRPHPPLFIGGGGQRVLRLAAQVADVVGLAPRLRTAPDGSPVPEPYSMTLAGAQEKVEWVRAAAGDRFPQLELNTYPSGGPLLVTSNATAAAQDLIDRTRRRTGTELTVAEILESPHVFIGSVAGLTDKILRLREGLGITSFMLGDVAAATPLVERLAGQ
jgi:probable F420-dependent oxidoreductase